MDTLVTIYMGTTVPQFGELAYYPLAKVFIDYGYTVRIKSIPNLGLGRLDESSDALAQETFSDPSQRHILVGHSQGALHALHHAKQFHASVDAVFAFAAPFYGTHAANLGLKIVDLPAIRTMATNSRFLTDLRAGDHKLDHIHSIYTILDQLVVPWFGSTITGANNVVLAPGFTHSTLIKKGFKQSRGIELIDGLAGHLGVIYHPALHHYVRQELDKLNKV
jgi:pimeloyl-ACP methyl ester carboxylesterase